MMLSSMMFAQELNVRRITLEKLLEKYRNER